MDTNQVLSRRVEKVLPNKEGLAVLMGKKKIRLYQGFDPTGAHLHLGHSIGIKKLMDFANAGHEVIFLFGTGTVLVGDPSQRDTARKLITQEEIDENIKDWKRQVEPFVDFNKVIIKQNGNWLTKLTLKDIIKIASNISAVQLFKREMFQRRIKRGDTVWYHETMYPLLQGYDSVVMDVDLEIGGTDQEFNMLIGRELQQKMNNREKFVLTVPMIMGTDGKQMSKTSGNCVWLDDTPKDMFGKIMSIPDSQIVPYMELVTDIPLERVEEVNNALATGELHPMDAKKELGVAVVAQFHGEEAAQKSKENFESVFQKGKAPQAASIYKTTSGTLDLVKVLIKNNFTKSNSEARRLIEQGAIEWNGEKVNNATLEVEKAGTLRIGKHQFLKIVKE